MDNKNYNKVLRKALSDDTLMKVRVNNTQEKLLWERAANKELAKENHKLKSELLSKNTVLEKELKFYKEIYNEGYLKDLISSDEESIKIKNQKKELDRLTRKMFVLKLEKEEAVEKYNFLKQKLSEKIPSFIIEMENVIAKGSRFINPVESFFKRLHE